MRGWEPLETGITSDRPFTAAVETGGFVYLSGQASVDAKGVIIPGTFEEEMRRSMANVVTILESVGLGLTDVFRVTAYVRDHEDVPLYNTIYREYFPDPVPSRTTLTNCLGPALKFEVDVIAVRPT
jgi:2-iminobutanoate/2-iminopropanoate deaminase